MPPDIRQRTIRARRCQELQKTATVKQTSHADRPRATSAWILSTVTGLAKQADWLSGSKLLGTWMIRAIMASVADEADEELIRYWLLRAEDLLVRADHWKPIPWLDGTESGLRCFVKKMPELICDQRLKTRAKDDEQPMVLYPHELPALRLHLVGRGQVGKNYTPKAGLRAEACGRATTLASVLVLDLSASSLHQLPAFVVREAKKSRDLYETCKIHPLTTREEAESITLPRKPTVCHFLRLPAELRNAIYEFAYTTDTDQDGEVNLLEAVPPTSSLRQTCKQVRKECNSMYLCKYRKFWRTTKFYIHASDLPSYWDFRLWQRQLRKRECEEITTLRISISTYEQGYYDAWMDKDHWQVSRVGGPLMKGVCGNRYVWNASGLPAPPADEFMFVYRTFTTAHDEYAHRVWSCLDQAYIGFHQSELAKGNRKLVPVKIQIGAVIKQLHKWL